MIKNHIKIIKNIYHNGPQMRKQVVNTNHTKSMFLIYIFRSSAVPVALTKALFVELVVCVVTFQGQ